MSLAEFICMYIGKIFLINYDYRIYKISPMELESENPKECPVTQGNFFFVKGHVVNSLVFAGHTVFVATTHHNQGIDNTETSGHGCAPVKLYLCILFAFHTIFTS